MIFRIAATHTHSLPLQDIDYVVCTGDLVPHHIWKVSREGNLAVVREMADLVKGFFPNIPIYGAVGNHESFPRDR